MFTEGVIFLMKRKTKTGLKLLTQLVERLKPPSENTNEQNKIPPNANRALSMDKAAASKEPQKQQSVEFIPDYIYNLVFLYRAYGYFVTEDYDSSLKDYIKANQIKKLNLSSLYNMGLC